MTLIFRFLPPFLLPHGLELGSGGANAELKWRGSVYKEIKPMTIRQPHYSKEEFARRGDDIYKTQVRPQIEESNHGKIVAIDIETGAFEVADELLAASKHLLARLPNAQTWFVRIGHPAVDHFGSRSLKTTR
jgi:hypothetical protein